MIRVLFIIGCLSFFTQASAQQFPVFKNQKDSIQYARVFELIQSRFTMDRTNVTNINTNINYDSLNAIAVQLRKKVIGWSQHYAPNKKFIDYADLKAGKVSADTIVRLTISNIRSAEVPKEVLACKNLEELELVNTQIDVIQQELNSLDKLTSLYVFIMFRQKGFYSKRTITLTT